MMEFTVGSPKIQETLYKRLIRSILEYGSRVRSPYQKTYNDAIESVKKNCGSLVDSEYTECTCISGCFSVASAHTADLSSEIQSRMDAYACRSPGAADIICIVFETVSSRR